MLPPIIKVDMEEMPSRALERAANIIQSGGAVAFPTESFYGLAVNALDEKAIRRLFFIKKRQSDEPILILIPSLKDLDAHVVNMPHVARQLIGQFWPGGLTLIFEAQRKIPAILTAGTGKIGIRLSSHPIATGLAQAVGFPITGTSANVSGQPPCTRAIDVVDSFGNAVDLVLDGGETGGGKGSTILDVTLMPPRILREGMVDRENLEKALSS